MEYIEREAAKRKYCETCDWYGTDLCNGCETPMSKIPVADVAPIRYGKWIWDENGMDWGIGAWRCSECKSRSPMWWNTNKTSPIHKSGHRYCPNCGAKME